MKKAYQAQEDAGAAYAASVGQQWSSTSRGGRRKSAPSVGDSSRQVAVPAVVAPAVAVAAGPKRKQDKGNDSGINHFSKIAAWIMGTGAGMDIISEADVPKQAKPHQGRHGSHL